MLLAVHDELIGECPKENKDVVAERLTFLMKNCVSKDLSIPFKCDPDISDNWYFNNYVAELKKQLRKLQEKGLEKEKAIVSLITEHTEFPENKIRDFLNYEN